MNPFLTALRHYLDAKYASLDRIVEVSATLVAADVRHCVRDDGCVVVWLVPDGDRGAAAYPQGTLIIELVAEHCAPCSQDGSVVTFSLRGGKLQLANDKTTMAAMDRIAQAANLRQKSIVQCAYRWTTQRMSQHSPCLIACMVALFCIAFQFGITFYFSRAPSSPNPSSPDQSSTSPGMTTIPPS